MVIEQVSLYCRAAWATVYMVIVLILAIVSTIILVALKFFETTAAYPFYFASALIYGVCCILLGFSWSTMLPKNDYAFIVFLGTIALGATCEYIKLLELSSLTLHNFAFGQKLPLVLKA